MRFRVMTALTASLILMLSGSISYGKAMPITPVPLRVAQADCVVVGKVIRFEENNVKAPRAPGEAAIDWKIAVVKIKDPILAPRGLTHIRIGYQPTSRVVLGGYGTGSLAVDHEVCLYLQKHAKESFYMPRMYMDVVSSKHPQYQKELADAKKTGKLLEDPVKALKTGKQEDRSLAAILLIQRYRYTTQPTSKQVPIPQEESKLILQNLAKADWTPGKGIYYLQPQQAFAQLRLSPTDGWKQPTDYRMIAQEAKKWLERNASTYRIKKYLP